MLKKNWKVQYQVTIDNIFYSFVAGNQLFSDKNKNKIKGKGGVRGKWTSQQKEIVKAAFKDHIKSKRAPRKEETEVFMKKHGDLFKDKSWVTVKAFIYNAYKDTSMKHLIMYIIKFYFKFSISEIISFLLHIAVFRKHQKYINT